MWIISSSWKNKIPYWYASPTLIFLRDCFLGYSLINSRRFCWGQLLITKSSCPLLPLSERLHLKLCSCCRKTEPSTRSVLVTIVFQVRILVIGRLKGYAEHWEIWKLDIRMIEKLRCTNSSLESSNKSLTASFCRCSTELPTGYDCQAALRPEEHADGGEQNSLLSNLQPICEQFGLGW